MAIEKLTNANFTCDAFASADNARCVKFYSKVACPKTSGINAFLQDWTADFTLCCPPVKLIPEVVQHIRSQPCQGVLLLPRWPVASIWPLITQDGSHFLEIFFQYHEFFPVYQKGKFCDQNLFDGRILHFSLLALTFNSTIPTSPTPSSRTCIHKGCKVCSK